MSEDKIIARRNRLIEWQKTQEVRSSVLYEIVDENISSINYLLYQLQQKENIIKETRDYIKEAIISESTEFYGLIDGEHVLAILERENK